jgi:DNA-binding transcriptional LysR family regulator
MIPSPAELTYFVEVAATLNISRAAERLGISQPSLSLAVKRLEDAVGVALLVRSKSGVSLTRSGQQFVIEARQLLDNWERVRGDAVRQETELTGRYSLGCHESVALYTFPQILPTILETNPHLSFKLTHGLSRQVTDDVIGFKIDFGIAVNPVEHPDLVIKLLAKDEVELYTGPTKTPLNDPKSNAAILISDPDLMQSQSLYKQIRKKGWDFPRTLTSSNLEVIASLVAAGSGVGILPGRVAGRNQEQKLRRLGGGPKYADRICLVYRADAQKTRASKNLIKSLSNALKDYS